MSSSTNPAPAPTVAARVAATFPTWRVLGDGKCVKTSAADACTRCSNGCVLDWFDVRGGEVETDACVRCSIVGASGCKWQGAVLTLPNLGSAGAGDIAGSAGGISAPGAPGAPLPPATTMPQTSTSTAEQNMPPPEPFMPPAPQTLQPPTDTGAAHQESPDRPRQKEIETDFMWGDVDIEELNRFLNETLKSTAKGQPSRPGSQAPDISPSRAPPGPSERPATSPPPSQQPAGPASRTPSAQPPRTRTRHKPSTPMSPSQPPVTLPPPSKPKRPRRGKKKSPRNKKSKDVADDEGMGPEMFEDPSAFFEEPGRDEAVQEEEEEDVRQAPPPPPPLYDTVRYLARMDDLMSAQEQNVGTHDLRTLAHDAATLADIERAHAERLRLFDMHIHAHDVALERLRGVQADGVAERRVKLEASYEALSVARFALLRGRCPLEHDA